MRYRFLFPQTLLEVYMLKLPASIQSIIGESPFLVDQTGMSDSQVICFDNKVLKIEKTREESNNEYRMMNWLQDKICVPEVLCFETMDNVNYLLMSKIEGRMLCDVGVLEKPGLLISLLAEGLKMLWSVDISDCPYNNSVDNKLRLAETRVANNLCGMDNAEMDTYGEKGFKSPSDLLAWLKDNKPAEHPVLSHGDYCLPNIFTKDGKVTGFIDLGRCGMADKYQDIALCCRSLEHNLSGSYTGKDRDISGMLFDKLGIEPDQKRIQYYILLDELF